MIQQFHFWVFIRRKKNTNLKRYVHTTLKHYYDSQDMKASCLLADKCIKMWRYIYAYIHTHIHTNSISLYTHVYSKILLSHQKRTLTICDNENGSRGYYARWIEKDKYFMTSEIWKAEQTKTAKWKQTPRYRESSGSCQREGRGWGAKKMKRIETHRPLDRKYMNHRDAIHQKKIIVNNTVILCMGTDGC